MTDISKEAVLKEATEACRDMARWIANSRIKAVRPLWESHMQKAQRAIDMINAENETLRKAVDSYSYIGRDGKMVLAKDLEDERDALRAQLQAAKDEAFEGAALRCDAISEAALSRCKKTDFNDYHEGRSDAASDCSIEIRALKSTRTEGEGQ